jgi:DNA-binding transcriptional LysR family regulator
MTILVAAVDTGSLSAASRSLRMPLATVSRRVAELEQQLKIRLLHRGNRKVVLTDAGRDYVASCRRLLEEIAEVERTASGEYRAPQGELTISMTAVLGRTYVLPIITDFLRAYPDIRMHLQLTDRMVSLLEEHVDVAVRIGELPDSGMVATRVGLTRQVTCASPRYLKVRGRPRKPDDLTSHDCVAYETFTTGSRWEFRIGSDPHMVEVPHRLVVNSGEAAVIAAANGSGIARVFSHTIDALGKQRALVELLEAYEPPPVPVNVVYHGERQVPLKLRAFLDFVVPRLRKRLGYKGTSSHGTATIPPK